MVCVLTPQCNFLYRYFWCQLPEDTIDVEVTVWTMKDIHTFKRDCSTQLISYRPWTSRYHPYPSLTKKMKTYLEADRPGGQPSSPQPHLPLKGPDMPSLPKAQTSKKDTSKETKKRNKLNKQTRGNIR